MHVSFSCVCPVIDNEFRHNIVKVVCGSTRLSPKIGKQDRRMKNWRQFVKSNVALHAHSCVRLWNRLKHKIGHYLKTILQRFGCSSLNDNNFEQQFRCGIGVYSLLSMQLKAACVFSFIFKGA